MLVPGSKGGTLDQFRDILSLKREEKIDKSASRLLDVLRPFKADDKPVISVSNGVWDDQQYPLRRSYAQLLRNVHKVDIKTVDLQCQAEEVAEEVNQWAKSKTKGMIKSILRETSYYNETVMILANTLHLKLETSETTCNPKDARHSLYHSGSYQDCDVLRMSSQNSRSSAGQDDRTFSMYIFVPHPKNGLLEFVKNMKLDARSFKTHFKRQNEEITNIYVPKFDLQSELPLSETMNQLGLTLPFKGFQGELMKFVDSSLADMLYVTDVTQKSRIETKYSGISTYTPLCWT